MNTPNRFPFKPAGHAAPALESRLDEYRGRLERIPPALVAERSGAAYLELGQGRGEFHLPFLGSTVVVTYPDFHALNAAGETLPTVKQALLVYYFHTANGAPLTGDWISFADLTDGRVYTSAFQGYSGDELAKSFLLELDLFQTACQKTGGLPAAFGDAAYRFSCLPRLDLLVVYHLGDEDFPSSCKVLFSANANQVLPTEACAILGSMLTQKILRAKLV
jgi:hypothetical protein